MAKRGVNKVILMGNVRQDPEVKTLPNGSSVASIRIATSETWNDKQSGEKQEKTEWHTVVFWGKAAELIGQYVQKGSRLYVEGKLQTRKWSDQSGADRYSTEIVAEDFQFVGSAQNGNQQGGQQQPQRQHSGQSQPQTRQQGNGNQDFDDDIPF